MLDDNFLAVARGEKTAETVLKNVQVVNVFSGDIVRTDIAICNGHIAGLGKYSGAVEHDLKGRYAVPGYIDGHVHIESSMVLPHNFGRAAVLWGTTTVVADPHEIANVLGLGGIKLMQASAELGPLDIKFTVPSCVPSTNMETSGASFNSAEVVQLLEAGEAIGLAEMMNFPGVVGGDADVLAKVVAAWGRPIDGHAPGLSGKALNAYAGAGIMSDHECTTVDEAAEKLNAGMHIMIREGSTAKNLETLISMVNDRNFPRFMLVTDDVHPDTLLSGHLNKVLNKAVRLGLDTLTAIRLVTVNPAVYFGLRRHGAIAPGYQADIVMLDDLSDFTPGLVYKKGVLVARDGKPAKTWPRESLPATNGMNVDLPENPFRIRARGETVKVIGVVPGQIITRSVKASPAVIDGEAVADVDNDVLKIAVVERHCGTGNVGLGFVQGFGLKRGALASSVAHDSHNIITVGVTDADMEEAVREVIAMNGGLAVADSGRITCRLPLPVAGLMSDGEIQAVAERNRELKEAAVQLGCCLKEPFMAMSFLSLPVIPDLKITDRGLVDVARFKYAPLFEEG